MTKLTQTVIPGIVAIVFGFSFLLNGQRIIELIKESHSRFWKGVIGFHSEVGRSGELFLKTIIAVLGIGFLFAGFLLIYQYFKKG